MHREAGFSLIEAATAAVVLALGVLGVVGSGTAARRLADSGSSLARAAAVAQSRLALLAANPCAAASGAAGSGPWAESWLVAGAGVLRDVTVTVAWPDGPRSRTLRIGGTLLCPGALP